MSNDTQKQYQNGRYKNNCRFTEEQKKEIIKLYNEGKTSGEISNTYNCHYSDIWRVVKKAGCPIHNRQFYNDGQVKHCSKCKKFKPLLEFQKNKCLKDGLTNQCKSCKSCKKEDGVRKRKENIIPTCQTQSKVCAKCNKRKNLKYFYISRSHSGGYSCRCKKCIDSAQAIFRKKNKEHISSNQKIRYRKNISGKLLQGAKLRAKKYGLEFNITKEDIIVLTHCPVLGIPLFVGNHKCTPNSPTLDRIDNTKGYIKGNTIVISHKANTIKSSATTDELYKVYQFYKNLESSKS